MCQTADDGAPEHGLEDAVNAPQQGHHTKGIDKGHAKVAQQRSAECKQDIAVGLYAVANVTVDQLTAGVDAVEYRTHDSKLRRGKPFFDSQRVQCG